MAKQTIKATLAAVRALGMACGYKPEYREFRISYPAHIEPSAQRREDTACYETDPASVVGTAQAMKDGLFISTRERNNPQQREFIAHRDAIAEAIEANRRG